MNSDSEPKNYWNDPEPQCTQVRACCPDCRTDFLIQAQHYPHGPKGVKYCPTCGSQHMNFISQEGAS